jgi:hypothetical protein
VVLRRPTFAPDAVTAIYHGVSGSVEILDGSAERSVSPPGPKSRLFLWRLGGAASPLIAEFL